VQLPVRGPIAVAAFALATTVAAAQTVPPAPAPPQGAQSQAPVYGPTLKTIPEAPGWKVAMLQGATDANGDRFLIPNLETISGSVASGLTATLTVAV
jgi:hypothetical protein